MKAWRIAAGKWVRIAKETGMRYLVVTAKHHDGFAMWDSHVTDYTYAQSNSAAPADFALSGTQILANNFGSGQGWDAGWPVAWNVTTTYFLIQAPPGTDKWCIGCVGTVLAEAAPGGDGTILPNGIYDSLGAAVTPGSLYLAQLQQRLGNAALRNIGYADTNGTPLPQAECP